MDPEELECEKLLCAGDPQALSRILKRFSRPLYSFLYHSVGDRQEAEDLLQETMIRVWVKRASYEPRGRLAGWLFTIARRLALDHMDKRRLRKGSPLPDPAEPAALGPEGAAESGSERTRIEASIAALPHAQREVFLLREYGQLSFAEIAQALGCPLGTALARMRYAVMKLRKDLKDLHA